MYYHLALDSEYNPVELQQAHTLRGQPNDLPYFLIDTVTQLGGYWEDEDEQEFWERWVVYREEPEKDRERMLASVRRLVQRSVLVHLSGPKIGTGTVLRLRLTARDPSAPKIPLMELEVSTIEYSILEP